jgi:hypothetical protein
LIDDSGFGEAMHQQYTDTHGHLPTVGGKFQVACPAMSSSVAILDPQAQQRRRLK